MYIPSLLLGCLVMLSQAHTTVQGGQIELGGLVTRLSPHRQAVIRVVTLVFLLVITAFLVQAGSERVIVTLGTGRSTAILLIPWWPFSMMLPVGCLVLWFVFLLQLVLAISHLRRGASLDQAPPQAKVGG